MSDQIDRKTTTHEVNSNSPVSGSGYRVSEQSTTRNDDSSSAGLIIGILLTLGLGVGAVAYFMNNRSTTPVLVPVPGATNTVKENNSTVIERNNTTKEVKPSTAPKVEINVPAPAAPTQPQNAAPTPSQSETAPNTNSSN